MARPIWNGYITFGLVNIPVILYASENKANIPFKLLDKRDKSPIRYQRINENTEKEVPWKDIVKGYEYEQNNFVLFSEAELKELTGEHSKTINIENFININNLNQLLFEKFYYLVPDKKGNKGYVILRETLEKTKKVGIAKVVIHTKEYLATLMPYEKALILTILHYPEEIKKPAEYDLPEDNIKSYKISAKELEIAKQLVDSMTTKWNPELYHNEHKEKLEKWIHEKIHHEKPKKSKLKNQPSPKNTNVISFVDLLKKSLHQKKPKPPSKSASKRKAHH